MTAYRGTPVSEGVAAGQLYLPDAPVPPAAAETETGRATVTADDVRAAFSAVAADRGALAGRLRASGRDHEADIVTIGALMAADPALSGPAVDALTSSAAAQAGPAPAQRGADRVEHGNVQDDTDRFPVAVAVDAVTAAAETQALVLAALPDPDLAQRASDVRQVAAAVVARLGGGSAAVPPPEHAFILVRADVDPADLIRLVEGGRLAGAVSVGGGATSHAAIIARGLGLPMLAGADPGVLAAPAGRPAVLDADGHGSLVVDPNPADLARARAGTEPAAAVAAGAARTADGEEVTILCNVASAAETRLGLANGAAGVGLLRTEIPFTGAAGWPSRADHLAALTPVLGLLHGRRAVVRLLDFAGDKVPPFPGAEGLPAFLHAPGALAAQLSAILQAGAGTDLAIMIPMVKSVAEVGLVRAELVRAATAAGVVPPPLGMMVELDGTARTAAAFAGTVEFFSIGTNDLAADVLGRDRSALGPADAARPPVLAAIAATVRAAGEAGIGLSVCGDSAADPAVLPLLLSLGVRTISVGAAKVPAVARWVTTADTTRPVTTDAA
jgi:phosphoenolpyruvate-protein kinase (PTS system EI component)